MEISEVRSYQLTPSYTEKLRGLFLEKAKEVIGCDDYQLETFGKKAELWLRYLDNFPELEHIRKFSMSGDVIDYLLAAINENGGRIVIRDPINHNDFILINKDFAEKVMALGGLP